MDDKVEVVSSLSVIINWSELVKLHWLEINHQLFLSPPEAHLGLKIVSNELVKWFQVASFFLEVCKGSAGWYQVAHSLRGWAGPATGEWVPPWRKSMGQVHRARSSSGSGPSQCPSVQCSQPTTPQNGEAGPMYPCQTVMLWDVPSARKAKVQWW